mgnify:CR=1 FL=1
MSTPISVPGPSLVSAQTSATDSSWGGLGVSDFWVGNSVLGKLGGSPVVCVDAWRRRLRRHLCSIPISSRAVDPPQPRLRALREAPDHSICYLMRSQLDRDLQHAVADTFRPTGAGARAQTSSTPRRQAGASAGRHRPSVSNAFDRSADPGRSENRALQGVCWVEKTAGSSVTRRDSDRNRNRTQVTGQRHWAAKCVGRRAVVERVRQLGRPATSGRLSVLLVWPRNVHSWNGRRSHRTQSTPRQVDRRGARRERHHHHRPWNSCRSNRRSRLVSSHRTPDRAGHHQSPNPIDPAGSGSPAAAHAEATRCRHRQRAASLSNGTRLFRFERPRQACTR